MIQHQEITKNVHTGAQPQESDLEELQQAGYSTVVNLRVPHEEESQLAPEDEGTKVRELGMSYLHIPVTMKQIRPEQVEEFSNALNVLEGPVYVHCKSGTRANIFAILHTAVDKGWSPDEAVRKGKEAGIKGDKPEILQFMKEYVQQHAG